MNRGIILASFLLAALADGSNAAQPPSGPVIQHVPIPVAPQGQSIAVKATVAGKQPIQAVVLHYSTSRDVAPFKIAMHPAGRNVYVATIPAHLLTRARELTYYIEALDQADAVTETSWHTVSIRATQPADDAKPPAPDESSGWWKTPALVGGGILLVGGGAAVIAANSSKHSHSSDADNAAGTYVGSVSRTLEIQGQNPATSAHGITILVQPDGNVTSADLHPGLQLHGSLDGLNFSLVATLSDTNMEGQITYSGSVADDRISGSAGGTVRMSSGSTGIYYGSFYAIKQP